MAGYFFKSRIFNGKHSSPLKTLNDRITDNPDEILKSVYADNFPWLENYILQNSGNSDDARDVFQESIFATWLNLRSGKFIGTRDQLNAYVRQICKYKWINQLRSANKKKTAYSNSLPDAPTDHFLDSQEEAERHATLSTCIARLGHKCRKVLTLFYFKKKSLAAIATDMHNTEESIKTIKYRCMMQLRKHYMEAIKKDGTL